MSAIEMLTDIITGLMKASSGSLDKRIERVEIGMHHTSMSIGTLGFKRLLVLAVTSIDACVEI